VTGVTPDERRFTAICDAYRQNVWAYAAGRQAADEAGTG
jgi:RNA polymerase sigma-70 factor (ECF subfamily)